jgi:hypothetical protein
MTLQRILVTLLLTSFMAHSQPTPNQPADSSTNLPSSLNTLLTQNPGLKLSKVPGAGRDTSQSPETAGIFLTKEVPPLKALLLSLDPTLKISEGRNGDTTNFTCTWPDVAVRFTIKSHWNGPEQRLQMKSWIASVPGGDTNTPAVESLLQKVNGTVACIGSVITPHYDAEGKASALVLGLVAKLDGYVFAQRSFYDSTGAEIIGLPDAPSKLGYLQ